MKNIIFANPLKQYLIDQKAINQSIKKVLNSDTYIGGKAVDIFEKNFANYHKSKYAISCNSGTDALYLALKAVGVGKGDEIILPSHSAVATATAVKQTGATLIFADIESDYYTIDPLEIKKLINKKTKALIVVHIYGHPCNMQKIIEITKKKNIFLIEDCAQSLGSKIGSKKVGTFGDIGCFSFYPTKNLGAIGDGGCVITNNFRFNKYMSAAKNYGWEKNDIKISGMNSRLDSIQAAILDTKLKKIDQDIKFRIDLAKKYLTKFRNLKITLPKIRIKFTHSFHLFVIQVNKRAKFIKFMQKHQIFTGLHYQKPIHHIKVFKNNCKLPVTEKLYRNIVTLPLYPGLTSNEQSKIIKIIKRYFNENK